MKKQRSAYWDNWKGLAIVAVVLIHASGSADTFPQESFNWHFGLGLRQVVNFAVPMFLALSGYFAAEAARESAADFYRRKIWRLMLPYAVWTAVYLVVRTPLSPPSTAETFSAFAYGTGIGVGYFVVVLLQYIALTPLLARIRRMRTHVVVMCAMTLFGMAFTYYFRAEQTSSFFSSFPGAALPFFVWYPFYHFGFFVGRHEKDLRLSRTRPAFIWSVLLVGLATAFTEGMYWASEGMYSAGISQIKASSYAVSLTLFVMAMAYANRETWLDRASPLTWLGQHSYPIYLIHMLFLVAATTVFKRFEAIWELQPAYVFLATTVTLASCAILVLLLKKYLPPAVSRIVLG